LSNSEKATNGSQPDSLSNQGNILLENAILHHFSSNDHKDTFRISVTGPSIIEGDFHFQIISPQAGVIYDQRLTTEWLIDYGAEGNTTIAGKADYIRKRIDNFFNPKNFISPAIGEKERFDSLVSTKSAWENINSDRGAIGFYYLVGKEDGRKIAYSKTLGRVLLYYNCC
jgi:hypothetical protein